MYCRLLLPSLLVAVAVSSTCAAAIGVAAKSYPVLRAVGEGPDGDDNGERHLCTGIQPVVPAVICVRGLIFHCTTGAMNRLSSFMNRRNDSEFS